MIDEADKFVAGPQNKIKRPGEPNTAASLKRRHSMSLQIDGLSVQMASSVSAVMGEDGMLPSDLNSLPDEFNCLNEDGLDRKPGTNALVRGPLNYSTARDNQKRVMESTSESVLNSLKITPTMLEGSDADIKIRVMKEVCKPGRNYEKIFSLLEEVEGPMEIQKFV
uniref:INTS6/SAGE1/DDX26B/CT45 C-terminal domain-containing protein n=1 Tax=Cairina moschata TaxID=8855 RepID=A0A8C3GFS7_CAIMO